LLLALNNSLEPELRDEIEGRAEKISLNPFENDLHAEANLALQQYQALVAFAKDPSGLAAKVERDRRAELVPLEHGRNAQIALRVLNVLSFGKYVHREEGTVDMEDRLDIARRLRSLHFIAQHGSEASASAASAAAKIFARTKDDETRRACLDSLSRIGNSKAKNELLRISQNPAVDQTLRDIAAEYLRGVNAPVQPIAVTVNSSPVKVGQP
jgi:hypothetical protein